MRLMVPSGSWFDWLAQASTDPVARPHAATDEPTQADVDEAIEAMRAGHVEYVILDADDGTFVQAAGSGEGGYQLEHWAAGEAVSSMPGATIDEVRAAMAAYLQGDRPSTSASSAAASPGDGGQGRRRRWFGRG